MAEQLAKVLEQLIHNSEIKSVADVLEQSCSKKVDKPSEQNCFMYRCDSKILKNQLQKFRPLSV